MFTYLYIYVYSYIHRHVREGHCTDLRDKRVNLYIYIYVFYIHKCTYTHIFTHSSYIYMNIYSYIQDSHIHRRVGEGHCLVPQRQTCRGCYVAQFVRFHGSSQRLDQVSIFFLIVFSESKYHFKFDQISVYLAICTYTYINVYTYIQNVWIYVYTYMYTYMHVYMYTCIHIYIYVYICIYMYIYTDIQVTISHAIDNTTISVVLFSTIVA